MSSDVDKNEMYCNACIRALMLANTSITQARVGELLKRRDTYGKKDTLALDAIPEIQIKDYLLGFDPDSALITEEQGRNFLKNWPSFSDIKFHPSVFFCDPTDRSSFLKKFLEFLQTNGYEDKKLAEALAQKEMMENWEKIAERPASITGSVSAITCVRRGRIIFSVLLNYITQELIVACSSGIKSIKLADCGSNGGTVVFDRVMSAGRPIEFSLAPNDWDCQKYFTAFMGAEGKTGYAENIRDSEILPPNELKTFGRYHEPGGPARILYLSSLHLKEEPMGFILANGEKVTEWIHWLPFIRFAKQGDKRTLRLFEISHARPWTKEGVLMAAAPIYSVFQQFDGITAMDINFLKRFPNPSRYRSTLIVAPYNNEWVNHIMQELCYREITLE